MVVGLARHVVPGFQSGALGGEAQEIETDDSFRTGTMVFHFDDVGCRQRLPGGVFPARCWLCPYPMERSRSSSIFPVCLARQIISVGSEGKPEKWNLNAQGGAAKESRIVVLVGADGGGRTHTLLRVLDFESSASANSATSATRNSGLHCFADLE